MRLLGKRKKLRELMYRLVKTPKAERDLIAIWQFTYHEWGEAKANEYLRGLEVALNLLRTNPLLHPERTEFKPPVRFLKYKRHICPYLVKNSKITIIRALHERMDLIKNLKT